MSTYADLDKHVASLIKVLNHSPDAKMNFSITEGNLANELYGYFNKIKGLKVYLNLDHFDDLWKLEIYNPLNVFKPGNALDFGE